MTLPVAISRAAKSEVVTVTIVVVGSALGLSGFHRQSRLAAFKVGWREAR